jgi:hypothetical protein
MPLNPFSSDLPSPWDRRYLRARAALVAAYAAGAATFAFAILFPAEDFRFDFRTPLANKNTVIEPRTADGVPVGNGQVADGAPLVFDTALQGSYSHAALAFDLEREAPALREGSVSVRKSYRAFLYPEGPPAAFPSGTLLKRRDDLFLVDGSGARVRFGSSGEARRLGYRPEAFLEVSDEELALNPEAPDVSGKDRPEYPDGALFHIGETYYQLLGGKLHPFVSENAYLTQHAKEQAAARDPEFLGRYPVSEEWIGFRSGSLLAFADGVFVVDGTETAPVGSAVIFENFGYDWNDVIPASEEEIGIYRRGKIVLNGTPHPDGTVFVDADDDRHFLIQGRKRREIASEKLLRILLGSRRAVPVSSKALSVSASCPLDKSFLVKRYSCDIPLDAFEGLPGNTFEFRAAFFPGTDLRDAQVVFETAVNEKNLRYSLSQIKQRILSHYGYGQ